MIFIEPNSSLLESTNLSIGSEFQQQAYSSNPAKNESILKVECMARTRIPTPNGQFYLHIYKNNCDTKEHLAIVFGEDIRSRTLDSVHENETPMDRIVRGAYQGQLNSKKSNFTSPKPSNSILSPLVRIHSECFTGETVFSVRCDCGDQLSEAMQLMINEGRGIIVYLRQEGRGIGLLEKIKAYNLQDLGYDTVAANIALSHPTDLRTYNVACAILQDLQAPNIRLLTNNPEKLEQLEKGGLCIKERIPMVPKEWSHTCQETSLSQKLKTEFGYTEVDTYLRTKVERMRHLIEIPQEMKGTTSKKSQLYHSSI
ncbi:GTP cyclohydrolase II [Basidiobolus ranarum]|uniref:GTP cyclohydrolase II n=1 Tax=Basidiobolus ranarum TaxID=34480 RepID=A0ABR2VNI2_9FUNG